MAKRRENKAICEVMSVAAAKTVVRLSLKIPRSEFDLLALDAQLVNSQVEFDFVWKPGGKKDIEGQETFADENITVSGIGSIKRAGVSATHFTMSVSVPKSAVNMVDASNAVGATGKFGWTRVGEAIPTEEDDSED